MIFRESASFDLEVLHLGDHADAGPTFGLHFVEIFQTGEVSSGVWSSSFCSLFADGVGKSEVIDAGNLHGFGTLLGGSEASEEGNESEENGLHLLINNQL